VSATWPVGDAALLVDAEGFAPALASAISGQRLAGVLDVVPGAATVLIVTEPGSWDLAGLAQRILALPLVAGPEQDGALAEIPVTYDGPDLTEVAELAGLEISEVVARHQAGEYRVGWLGFSPGFGYLTGLDPALAEVPRLATPRLSVPAGSVAIAGGLAAVYPADSPGGWRILGRTAVRLWDPQRDPPALLAPGMRVRFRPAEPAEPATVAQLSAPDEPGSAAPGAVRYSDGSVEILRPGPLATIQDLGRPGYAHLGVPRSGAADPASLRRANRLAGNADDAAALEFTLGRAELRFHGDALVAISGAPTPISITRADDGRRDGALDDRALQDRALQDRALAVTAGSVLRLSAPATGLRTYLAVHGGIDIPPVLGSRSADLLSGLGPRPLRAGDRLPVGSALAHAGVEPRAGRAASGPRQAQDSVRLRIVAGPRDDWFAPGALGSLTGEAYQVTPASNRTGLRLAGARLARARTGELPSEGLVAGAIQVPPDGQPILLLADHPATGGYPVIAVVPSADIGDAAQLRPGQRVRFELDRPV
jgi:KipI family sensor histidine kinase inhibitor